MEKKILPIGFDDYKQIIEEDFYYVDKTLFVKELLDNISAVNLFTRPRRFGKTLNLSMLRYFFEKPVSGESNKHLFEGKKILNAGERYLRHQEKYPVIFLSLKSGKQETFSMAYEMLKDRISKEFERHCYVINSLTAINKKTYEQILNKSALDIEWYKSIEFLSCCLEQYYNQKVVILIDEYDVPLENAYYQGFYDKMISFIRSLFESALKSNSSLAFAVITGCLRISKESIFTGMNNLDIISILNTTYGEHFGFVQDEANKLLEYYGVMQKHSLIKEWYDGYRFGNTDVYNPWSLLNYVKNVYNNPELLPVEYWSNTSSNAIVKDLLTKSDDQIRDKLEILTHGGNIEAIVHEDITYQDIYESEENLWNFLFFTGYLKSVGVRMVNDRRTVQLEIPNKEILNIYRQQITSWSQQSLKSRNLSPLFLSMLSGDAPTLQYELSKLLVVSVSYMDSYEDFYHGFLLGILTQMEGFLVTSNREAGDGRYDICVTSRDGLARPVILEFKTAGKQNQLMTAVQKALQQIIDKRYDIPLEADGYEKCMHIGIGFYRKMCRVQCVEVRLHPEKYL